MEVYLVDLDRLLRATTKKVVNFLGEISVPRHNPGYAYTFTAGPADADR